MTRLAPALLALGLSLGCARGPSARPLAAPEPSGAPREGGIAWADFDPAAFARAKAEQKLVILDGAAEWCHYCHVMEATTYHDPRVREVIDAHFVATKIDVDARPDIEERYGAWGWPATVVFTAEGEELGKYRGYLPPDALLEVLQAALASRREGASRAPDDGASAGEAAPVGAQARALAHEFARAELDEYYDPAQGGWGRRQKAAVFVNDAWVLQRAGAGDRARLAQAVFTLDQERKLLDPVWGGMVQYSAAADWDHPHFEKLMTYQAGAIESFARGYAVTRAPRFLAAAREVRRYVDAFLTSPQGGFYTTQDADLHAHEPGKPYLAGHEYYALGDRERRALGIPRIDKHVYGRENGLAIAAYVTLFEADRSDRSALDVAVRAAQRLEATHAAPRGGIFHDEASNGGRKVLYLADNAAYLWALVRLHEATGDQAWIDRAVRVAGFITRELEDPRGGAFFATAQDPDAAGVFRQRRKPLEPNVLALRGLAHLLRVRPDGALERALLRGLAPMVRGDAIKERGRGLGDLLLLLEEVAALPPRTE